VKKLVLTTLALLLISSFAQASSPGRKTDVVTLYNGDRITGEIKELFAGLLEVKTSSMGTIKIEWQEISQVQSKYRYEIRLTQGTRHYGALGEAQRPGELQIVSSQGDSQVGNLQVVEIRPAAQTFKDQIDTYVSLGYSYTNASSLGQGTMNADINYKTEKAKTQLTARLNLTETHEGSTRSSKIDLGRAVWTKKKDVYRLLLTSAETNDELALDLRLSVGAALGRHFVDTHRHTWDGALGMQVLTEKSLLGDTRESVEGVIRSSYANWKFSTPELHVKVNGGLYPSFTESGRLRGDGDINFRWEIIGDLYWDITAFGTYDNKAADDSRFDYGISTGVGWTY
jgi:hypothetical protein